MAKKKASATEAVERAWAFGIGQKVATDQGGGDAVWRRESSSGARDYLVKTKDAEIWLPESALEPRK